MIDISFEVNGRKVRPNQIADALERAMFEQVRDQLVRQLHGIRDPKTGALPKLKVKGRNLESLNVEIEGSPELIERVKNRLGKG
ncbi:MAG: hypothetical protein F4X94_10215 [Dehalococcoidia bacterium]|nr:hypothetical protein [Dehalococcoidia bacterium]